MNHRPLPLEEFDEQKVVLAVIQHFCEHYQESFSIPTMSRKLGISLIHIETAFDTYKGMPANQALLEYRLNRLCDRMTKDPSGEIAQQMLECGLTSFQDTNNHFMEQFGIDLVEFHEQCFIAAVARRQCKRKNRKTETYEMIGETTKVEHSQTKFHQ